MQIILSMKYFVFGLVMLIGITQAYAAGISIPSGASLNVAGGTLNIAGDISNSGTLQLTTGTIALMGNWANTGTFTAGTGTVNFNGAHQTISGSSTFHNLIKNVTTASTFTFASGTTQTITNSLNLQGIPAQLLSLRSSSAGAWWHISLPSGGTQALSFLDVRDANASGGQTLIAGQSSIDSGNNVNWVFSGEGGGGFGHTLFHFDSLGRPRVGTSNLSRTGTVVLRSGRHSVTIRINRITGEVSME